MGKMEKNIDHHLPNVRIEIKERKSNEMGPLFEKTIQGPPLPFISGHHDPSNFE